MRASLSLLTACVVSGSTLAFAPCPEPEPEPEVFRATFAKAAKDVTTGYGKFAYETTSPGWKAAVSGGRLRLLGDHDSGDQRLFITARKALEKPKWPDSLEVTTELGATAKDNGDWHVGVSVGGVKVLFHPDHPGGAFRAETVDAREKFITNQDMGFTPAAGVMHRLTVKVRRAGRTCRFEVELSDANGRGTYRKSFEVASKHLGDFDRIGLERSGRRGGDALFGSITIKPGK